MQLHHLTTKPVPPSCPQWIYRPRPGTLCPWPYSIAELCKVQTLTCSLEVSVAYLMGLNALGDNCINPREWENKPHESVFVGWGLGCRKCTQTHVWWKVNFPRCKLGYQSVFAPSSFNFRFRRSN